MNKPTFDGTLRLRPRINVPRGYGGNEPTSITRSAPLSDAINHTSADDTIYSGQPIMLHESDNGWIVPGMLYPAAGGTAYKNGSDERPGSKIFFAYHDSTDTDVGSSGLLLGFSALGKFEIESAWVVGVDALAIGDPLVVNAAGFLAAQGTAHDSQIVGYVSEVRDLSVGGHQSMLDLDPASGANTGAANPNANPRGGSILQDGSVGGAGTIAEDNTSATYDSYGTSDADGMWIVKFVTAA
jgi:hypothetical protein